MVLCVALDRPSFEDNLALANELKDLDIWIKVGFRSFLQGGIKLIEDLKKNEKHNIFLDLKLYDIPNTMADGAEEIGKMGVDMFNIHASAGETAMKTVMERVSKFESRPLVLAVTALTSFDGDSFNAVYNTDLETKATQFAKDAHSSGLDGVVCSVYESLKIKENTSSDFQTLTPGIRPAGASLDDQKRVATPNVAMDNRVDYIVVGRPIYKADNPVAVTEEILNSIAD
ncbi:MAG: orotidine-5'-phosphate decarboxylase [Campylobacterales bacterium]|nr:orotidine-5'-phosphate decarboxylase [Campylobacterales bacterium]